MKQSYTPQQRAFALKQAMVDAEVRALAKWLIVELEQRDTNDTNYFPYQKEEANFRKLKIRSHITLKVANDITVHQCCCDIL